MEDDSGEKSRCGVGVLSNYSVGPGGEKQEESSGSQCRRLSLHIVHKVIPNDANVLMSS